MLARNAGERFASTADLLAEFDRVDLALRVAADGHGASRGIWDLIIDLIRGRAKASRRS
jgi:hypothetical protein